MSLGKMILISVLAGLVIGLPLDVWVVVSSNPSWGFIVGVAVFVFLKLKYGRSKGEKPSS